MENEKLTDHEIRICKLEENEKVQDKRIEMHGQQIDEQKELSRQQGLNIEIIKKDVSNIDRTTKKTDDKIDKLYIDRISDHYIKPNERIKKYIDDAIKVVFGIIIAAFIYFLFPGLR
ncbi:hypothetical protein HMPREF3229_01608 [Peptoniphilus harei]|uniref:Uncharacterized protein n=1 Tax=Peptoniphilus harei TaxID=54005 RepID=A0A133PJ63_9FIRM|nr:hypothetical protein [Peptoniphilus harei]KXA28612.1 hypothetical protein HMPREF3229_01608 [Peptoniphilus harei]